MIFRFLTTFPDGKLGALALLIYHSANMLLKKSTRKSVLILIKSVALLMFFIRVFHSPVVNFTLHATFHANFSNLTFPHSYSLISPFSPVTSRIPLFFIPLKSPKNKNRTKRVENQKKSKNLPLLHPCYFQYPFPSTRTSIYSNSLPLRYLTILSISSAVTAVSRSSVVLIYPPNSAK